MSSQFYDGIMAFTIPCYMPHESIARWIQEVDWVLAKSKLSYSDRNYYEKIRRTLAWSIELEIDPITPHTNRYIYKGF